MKYLLSLLFAVCLAIFCDFVAGAEADEKTNGFSLPEAPRQGGGPPSVPEKTPYDPEVKQLTDEQRHHLQITIVELRSNISQTRLEAKKLNCLATSDDTENLALSTEECRVLAEKLVDLKDTLNILIAVGLVDDQVHKEDLPQSETRKKREAKLRQLSKELRSTFKRRGGDEKVEKMRKVQRDVSGLTRQKRGCSNPSPTNSKRAVQGGHTIEVSAGGGVGIMISASASLGTAYGQNGEYGCTTSQCWGFETNIGFDVGVAEGYYYKFDYVEGKSTVETFTAGVGPLSYSYGEIYADDEQIGYISGFGGGWGLLPVSVSSFSCETTLTKGPSCHVYTESFSSKYYEWCWSWNFFTCTKWRTSYRKAVRC